MNRAQIVDYFFSKLDDKDFTISQVRQELENKNWDEEEIKVVVQLVDRELQGRLLAKSENSKSSDLVWIGSILTAIGAGITIGTYIGLINMGDHYLITYGPFLGGVSILFSGLAANRTRRGGGKRRVHKVYLHRQRR